MRASPVASNRGVSVFFGGLLLVIFYLALFACIIVFDRIPFFFRTMMAILGLRLSRARLLWQLNVARGRVAASFDPPGIGDGEELSEEFAQASYACWKAGLQPWRIKLAGGYAAMTCKPFQPIRI